MSEKKRKVGMIGGGIDSFMGKIHREAMEKSGVLELVGGVFSSQRNLSYKSGKELGLSPERVYGSYRDFFRRESQLPPEEKIDFVTVVTSNGMHYPVTMAAVDAGIPVFCEKPFACVREEAVNLARCLRNSGLGYGQASIYPAYPALRKMREEIISGKELGAIRKVVTTFTLGWMAQRIENTGSRQAIWRTDPNRSGPGGCLLDLCTPCFSLTEWVTCLTVREVCGGLRACVPGRLLDDDCTVLARLSNGAEAVFLASQIYTGCCEGITLEIVGERASFLWRQDKPNQFTVRGINGETRQVSSSAPTKRMRPASSSPSYPYADSAYVDALSASYVSFVRYLEQQPEERTTDPPLFLTKDDGLRAVIFSDAVLRNVAPPEENTVQEKWTPLVVPPLPNF